MSVPFSYKKYVDYCERNDLIAHNVASEYELYFAYKCSVRIKRYLDERDRPDSVMSEEVVNRQIKRLDNERVTHMLNAKQYAEIFENSVKFQAFDEWIRQQRNLPDRLFSTKLALQELRREYDRWLAMQHSERLQTQKMGAEAYHEQRMRWIRGEIEL